MQEEAQESLSYALRHCHRNATRNKARILKYLIPVALLLGKLPSAALYEQYPNVLVPYIPLIEAMKSGDLGQFNRTMEEQQTIFIQDGTYLLLEKLAAAVQRRLLRKVWAIHAIVDPGKATQIPLTLFQDALRCVRCDIDMDEIECISANLVARKYVKGYISHRSKVMVVAKNDPFPLLIHVVLGEI